MIQPKSTKKYSDKMTGDYQVVLGDFVVKEKQIPGACHVVNLSHKVLREKTEKKICLPHHQSTFSVSRFAASLLLVFMAGNPLVPVFADELPPDFSDLAGTQMQTASEVIADESAIPPATEAEAVQNISDTAAETDEPIIFGEETALPEKEPSIPQSAGATAPIFTPIDTPDETEAVDEIATSTEEIQTAEPSETIPDTEENAETILPEEETATSTEETIPETKEAVTSTSEEASTGGTEENFISEERAMTEEETILNETDAAPTDAEIILNEENSLAAESAENRMQVPIEPTPIAQPKVFFKNNECTPTDDGGYYCVSKNLFGTTTNEKAVAPRVYAEAAANDDKEIYYEDANGKVRITSNENDDDSPSYDEQSGIILWHALINGHYQIMFYDRKSATTSMRRLTDTPHNNTNPHVKEKSAVWQGWINDNWEIFYVKDVTAPSLEIRQITSDARNDMFPHLSEKFITWQSFIDGTWHVFVYDMETGEISQVTKTNDGKYENPRFALLFEKRDADGMVQTIGYDMASGQEIPISHGDSAPAKFPVFPETDSNDKAMPLQSAGTSTLKTIGKDGEGGDA